MLARSHLFRLPSLGSKVRRWMVIALACAISAGKALAVQQGPVFRSLSVNEGLPDRSVEAIVQDAQGFIWIGTQGGLVRLEGGQIRAVPSDSENPRPLPGRNVMSMMAHSDGSVWVGIEHRGLTQIGPDLAPVRHLDTHSHGGRLLDQHIWSLAEDCSGRIWMAFMRGGVAVYDPASDELRSYTQSREAGLSPDGFQLHLEVDSSCRVWLVQSSQIASFNPEADRFETRYTPREGFFTIHLAEARGRIYFTEGRRLYDLGPTATATRSQPQELIDIGYGLTSVTADPSGKYLIISSVGGLHWMEADSPDSLKVARHLPGLTDSVSSNTLTSLLFDNEGGLWVASSHSGASYLAPGFDAYERFQPMPGATSPLARSLDQVMALAWDPAREGFWLGGQRLAFGFLGMDGEVVESFALPDDARQVLRETAIMDLLYEQEHLYLVAHEAVLRLDPERPKDYQVVVRREKPGAGSYRSVLRKSEGQLWILTQDAGLYRLDESVGEPEHFSSAGEGRHHVPLDAPRDLFKDEQGQWWLLGPDSLFLWTEKNGFTAQQIHSEQPFVAGLWRRGDLWLATHDSLQQWRGGADGLHRQQVISLSERVRSGYVMDLLLDQTADLWLVRSSGLTRYRPAGDSLRHFSRHDGLATVEFGKNASALLSDGRLAFGGQGGIVLVDPDRLAGVNQPPQVHITALNDGQDNYRFPPGEAASVELAHDRNHLDLDYLATSYLAPEHTRYRIQLEGWDSDWLELVGQTRQHYSNLPPGDYRFKVQAAAPQGPWSPEGAGLGVTVRQPPWLTTWAVASYAMLALILLAAALRAYRRASERRRDIEEARQKRAQAEEQRKIIDRLNRSLEPMPLARTIAQEIARLTSGRRAWLGYLDEQLPRELICSDPDADRLTREQWRHRLNASAGSDDVAVTLRVADRKVARVLVEAAAGKLSEERRERLHLLEEMAGQVLHNALLLQRVRTLAERTEQASNAKSEFLATMSHEIRTPLHGVLGMVELLYETETEPGQQDILDTLQQSGLQLQRIIDNVLDISRIEAGRLTLNVQPFDLAATLEQLVDLHAANAARKGLDLRLRIAADLPLAARGDADRLSQVVGNLLNNAVKFTEQGGVELSAARGSDDWLVLVVSDSGPGISRQDQERLFEPFTQLDASITRSYSGSGLGLAICRRLVNTMGGSLDLLKPCYGGSHFRVRLPLLESHDWRDEPMVSRLIAGRHVAASVTPPTLRILKGLARRWGFYLMDARNQPVHCDLLLIDPRTLDDAGAARFERWRELAGELAWLESPFPSRSGLGAMIPADARFLRWPLLESRFIGLLFDLHIGEPDAAGRSE